MEIRSDFFEKEKANTLYFGGGTPSVLNPGEIREVISWCERYFGLNEDAEITLEANPDDLSEAYIAQLSKTGINRLSIGIQSFDDSVLKFLNRRHSSRQSEDAIRACQNYSFTNLSLDFIYGIPGMSIDSWKKSLQKAVELQVPHISAYHLGIEENTVFGKWAEKGKLSSVEEEVSVRQYEILTETLFGAGFEQYEISNFALPGWHSRHNSAYWKSEPYLGLGPSAHSFMPGIRQWNPKNLDLYIASLQLGKLVFEKENLSKKDQYNDYILTSLRTSDGLNYSEVEFLAGENQMRLCMETVAKYLQTGHIVKTTDGFRLSAKGFFISDTIVSNLIW